MTNQSDKQASLRAKTGKALPYEDDWHAYWDSLAILPNGNFNERMLAWINAALVTSFTNLPSAQQAYAAAKGASNWDSLTALGLP